MVDKIIICSCVAGPHYNTTYYLNVVIYIENNDEDDAVVDILGDVITSLMLRRWIVVDGVDIILLCRQKPDARCIVNK